MKTNLTLFTEGSEVNMKRVKHEQADFLYAHASGTTVLCPNPHGRFAAMAQTAPDGSPRVWVFADPYVQAGKHGVIQISKEITLYHGPLNGSGGWMELRDMFAWTGLEMEAAKPALHVPFTGGKRAKPREVELAMRRDDSPFVAIQAYEQAIQVEVCVRFKSGNNTVEHFSLSHRQAWAAAHEARTHRVFLDTRTGHFHKVRRVREPIAGNLQIVIDVRNKPMEEST